MISNTSRMSVLTFSSNIDISTRHPPNHFLSKSHDFLSGEHTPELAPEEQIKNQPSSAVHYMRLLQSTGQAGDSSGVYSADPIRSSQCGQQAGDSSVALSTDPQTATSSLESHRGNTSDILHPNASNVIGCLRPGARNSHDLHAGEHPESAPEEQFKNHSLSYVQMRFSQSDEHTGESSGALPADTHNVTSVLAISGTAPERQTQQRPTSSNGQLSVLISELDKSPAGKSPDNSGLSDQPFCRSFPSHSETSTGRLLSFACPSKALVFYRTFRLALSVSFAPPWCYDGPKPTKSMGRKARKRISAARTQFKKPTPLNKTTSYISLPPQESTPALPVLQRKALLGRLIPTLSIPALLLSTPLEYVYEDVDVQLPSHTTTNTVSATSTVQHQLVQARRNNVPPSRTPWHLMDPWATSNPRKAHKPSLPEEFGLNRKCRKAASKQFNKPSPHNKDISYIPLPPVVSLPALPVLKIKALPPGRVASTTTTIVLPFSAPLEEVYSCGAIINLRNNVAILVASVAASFNLRKND